ncbi:conserved hypothetical protein [Vibrio vulnificus YJ016]|uniref:UPF0319 protein VV0984 n=2 Tax=Vibrio vulnificus TaxID=672 RepID=Y984_VIBVY|nr:DUF2057 domain-containing protein [Vibrio vulnificus]Q7MMT3.1 RecName: Full=UPF0319 protein VV0984; Flags: Precursor [Vibrio vulnificus YJ016]PWY33698.1 DUF2057 domain-containing protein [Vibrio vulnificus]BAC93748.1 conserved hypothetical protein [Vibrio vulnificus YJ016]
MRYIGKWMMLGALVSSSVFADVKVNIHRDVAPLVVNGEKVGFFISKKSVLDFDNGLNQLVVRVEKLIDNNQGEKEKFNSKPVIITFKASDRELDLFVDSVISRSKDAEEFELNPFFILKDKNGDPIQIMKQEILPNGGGITRDYETEVYRYNKKNNIIIASEKLSQSIAEQPIVEMEKGVEMVQYWYEKASNEDKKQFASLAFENRKSEIAKQNTKSQELDMLVYWFNQTSENGRKNIINWIMNN